MNKMEEIWKIAIENEPYEISNLGNLRRGEKILKGCVDTNNGYRYCNILKKNYSFHYLVAKAFIGERPEGMVIDHINRIRDDNRLDNLRYVTQRENAINSKRYHIGVERYESGRIKISKWNKIKREYGAGSLYNCPNGSWTALIQKKKILYRNISKTREEAEEFLNTISLNS